jgi:PAS domain S-box-containing protein
MDKRLRARERWLSTAMRSIGDAVVMVDLAGRITFLNPAAESLLGTKLSETLGQPARDVVRLHDAEWPPGEMPLDRALREGRLIQVPEAILQNSSGTPRIIADSAAPVIDEGEVLGAVMVFRDITEQKHLQKQLEVADRLASLGTMAAGVAHEINNPLAVIVGNAQVALEKVLRESSHLAPGGGLGTATNEELGAAIREIVSGETVEALRDILSAASRITRIVSDLRAFSRPERGASDSVDVRDPIEWAIRSTAHEFRHRARLSTKFERVPRVIGDETKLSQIFVNLLINAAQAIEPGNADTNEVAVRTCMDDAGRVVVEVSDTGSGIPPEALVHIFEPFFTTKEVGVGTGLGLSICHGIVASLDGELEVDSEVGKGSVFRVRLRASVSQRPSSPSSLPPLLAECHGRLLLIDDDDMVLKALSRVLHGHEIVATGSAREALAKLKEDDGFDIIFCDLMMPSMTGMDFYEELLRTRPEIAPRVVFMTGGAVTSKSLNFLSTVSNQRMEKPFNVGGVRAMVQRILVARKGA